MQDVSAGGSVKRETASPAHRQMLIAFQDLGYRMYEGTVPAKVKARRRAANKRARIARRVNRGD